MKNYFFCVVLFFIVSSCGIFGNEKVVPNESAVLSGPPLADLGRGSLLGQPQPPVQLACRIIDKTRHLK